MNLGFNVDDKVKILLSLSERLGVSADEILALYLILGDKIFFLFDLFQGKTLKFPSMRSFHHAVSSIKNVKLFRLSRYHYLINDVDSYRDGIKKGDSVLLEGVKCEALSSPQVFAGETYILCKVKE